MGQWVTKNTWKWDSLSNKTINFRTSHWLKKWVNLTNIFSQWLYAITYSTLLITTRVKTSISSHDTTGSVLLAVPVWDTHTHAHTLCVCACVCRGYKTRDKLRRRSPTKPLTKLRPMRWMAWGMRCNRGRHSHTGYTLYADTNTRVVICTWPNIGHAYSFHIFFTIWLLPLTITQTISLGQYRY